MKNTFLFLLLLFVSLSFTSCRKDWSCECSYNLYNDSITTYYSHFDNLMEKINTKKKAEPICSDIEEDLKASGKPLINVNCSFYKP